MYIHQDEKKRLGLFLCSYLRFIVDACKFPFISICDDSVDSCVCLACFLLCVVVHCWECATTTTHIYIYVSKMMIISIYIYIYTIEDLLLTHIRK